MIILENVHGFCCAHFLLEGNVTNIWGKNLKRVHAALSSNKKYLALWCMDKSASKIQISVYNFDKIKNYLYNKKVRESFSFKNNIAKADSWCLFSKTYKISEKDILKPQGSFQSMELTNKTKGGNWQLYICGGNKNGGKGENTYEKNNLILYYKFISDTVTSIEKNAFANVNIKM